MKTITINDYTGTWQAATGRHAPEIGAAVAVHVSCDAREWDDIKRLVRRAGMDLDFTGDNGEWNMWTVVKGEDQ